MGISLSKFRFNFNAIQTLLSRLLGDLCHIRFGDLWRKAQTLKAVRGKKLNRTVSVSLIAIVTVIIAGVVLIYYDFL